MLNVTHDCIHEVHHAALLPAMEATGRSATTSVAPPPPPTTSNRFTPVSQEPTSRMTTPPMPSGIPIPPPDLPRRSSTLPLSPGVQRMICLPETNLESKL